MGNFFDWLMAPRLSPEAKEELQQLEEKAYMDEAKKLVTDRAKRKAKANFR